MLVPVYWLLFALSRTIVCNNEAVKRLITQYGVRASKISPIPAFSVQYLQEPDRRPAGRLESFFARYPVVLFSYIRFRPTFFVPELIERFCDRRRSRPDVGLLSVRDAGHSEDNLPQRDRRPDRALRGLHDRVLITGDLTHEQFLGRLSRSAVYVRTPVSDGVASSVLEALSLGVPVVARRRTVPARRVSSRIRRPMPKRSGDCCSTSWPGGPRSWPRCPPPDCAIRSPTKSVS